MDCSSPFSSVHGVFQARVGSHSESILELVTIPFSSVSSLTKELNPSVLHFRKIIYHLRLLLIWIQNLLRNKRTKHQCEWTTKHFPFYGYSICFQSFASINSVAVNLHVFIYWGLYVCGAWC